MPRKCCTMCGNQSCKSNYRGHDYVTIYCFPSDPYERDRWLKTLPNQLTCKVSNNIGICYKHWPSEFSAITVKGRKRPRDPPSIFDVPASFMQRSTSYKPRDAEKRNLTAEVRTLITQNMQEKITKAMICFRHGLHLLIFVKP